MYQRYCYQCRGLWKNETFPCFFQHSASKYKNAGSCVQRDDSSFRQWLHYSGGFARNVDGMKVEGSSAEEREVDSCSMGWESWKFHNGLWWARLKVHWRFSGRKDTESGWRDYEADSKPFRPLDVLLLLFRREGKKNAKSAVISLTVNLPPPVFSPFHFLPFRGEWTLNVLYRRLRTDVELVVKH